MSNEIFENVVEAITFAFKSLDTLSLISSTFGFVQLSVLLRMTRFELSIWFEIRSETYPSRSFCKRVEQSTMQTTQVMKKLFNRPTFATI